MIITAVPNTGVKYLDCIVKRIGEASSHRVTQFYKRNCETIPKQQLVIYILQILCLKEATPNETIQHSKAKTPGSHQKSTEDIITSSFNFLTTM